MVDRQKKHKLIGDLIKTPQGRVRLGASFRYPLISRWEWNRATREWNNPSDRGGAYVLAEGEFTTIDLPLYHGEIKEEETFLQYKTLTAPDVCYAIERAMDGVVRELRAWENEQMLSLLRQAPISGGTGNLDSWLKQITEEKDLVRVLGSVHDLIPCEKIASETKTILLRCGSKHQYDGRVPVTFSRDFQGEVWAFEAGSGFSERGLVCEFIAHRESLLSKKPPGFSIKWKAHLKLGITHPGKIHKFEV